LRHCDAGRRRRQGVAGHPDEGTQRVTGIESIPGAGFAVDEMLTLAAAAERPSEHPIARAVTAAARDRALPAAEGFSSAPGRGVAAVVAGRRVHARPASRHARHRHR
jgi:cation transport ATPase